MNHNCSNMGVNRLSLTEMWTRAWTVTMYLLVQGLWVVCYCGECSKFSPWSNHHLVLWCWCCFAGCLPSAIMAPFSASSLMTPGAWPKLSVNVMLLLGVRVQIRDMISLSVKMSVISFLFVSGEKNLKTWKDSRSDIPWTLSLNQWLMLPSWSFFPWRRFQMPRSQKMFPRWCLLVEAFFQILLCALLTGKGLVYVTEHQALWIAGLLKIWSPIQSSLGFQPIKLVDREIAFS